MAEGRHITLREIREKYMNVCPDKENILTEEEFGRLLRKVYGTAIKRKRRTTTNNLTKQKKRTWVYLNIAASGTSDESNYRPNLEQYTPPQAWMPGIHTQHYVEWLLCTEYLEDQQRVFKQVRIFKDFSFEVAVNRQKVPNESFGFEKLQTQQDLDSFFQLVFIASPCGGFPVMTPKCSRNMKGEMVGKSVSWASVKDKNMNELRHRSLNCHGLLRVCSTSPNQKTCESCSSIKHNSVHNLNKASENDSASKYKKESFMSTEEKQAKLNRMKVDLKNARRREQQLRNKIVSDMLTYDESDHQDFNLMFEKIKYEELSEDMKLFWEEQHKTLQAKSSKGYRWHPK